MSLTHLDNDGNARMVDVSEKPATSRRAVASAKVRMSAATVAILGDKTLPKGDAFAVARIAGIQGAKRTSELIPLCHPLPLTSVKVDIQLVEDGVDIQAETATIGNTGVEMEALTAVTVASLAMYDMIKGVDRTAVITDIKLLEKSGGKSGTFHREE